MRQPQKRRGRPRKNAQLQPRKLEEPGSKNESPGTRNNRSKKQLLDAENNNVVQDSQSKSSKNENQNIDVVESIKMDWESDSEGESVDLKNGVNNNVGNIEFFITPFEEEVVTDTVQVKPMPCLTQEQPITKATKKKYKPRPKCKRKAEAGNEGLVNEDAAKENNDLNKCKTSDIASPKIVNRTESKKMEELLVNKKSRVVTLTAADMVEKIVRKIPKSQIQQSNGTNINKTESMKMEEFLVTKFKREQEKQGADNRFDELIKDDVFTFEDVKNYDVFVKTTKSLYETYEKVQDENGQYVMQCLLCEYATETFKPMSLHYKFKHRETPIEEMYFCNYKGCHYRAIHKGMYMWHLRRHSLAADKLVQALFMCDRCRIKFNTRKEYLIHLKHEHKVPEQPEKKANDFPCATCNYRATKLVYLKSHIYSCHVPTKLKTSYDCKVCGYKTYCKSYLERHVMTHLKQKKKKRGRPTKTSSKRLQVD